MPYRSKAQMGLFFSDPKLKKYAHKWAHETGMHHGKKGSKAIYAALPKKVKHKPKKKGR